MKNIMQTEIDNFLDEMEEDLEAHVPEPLPMRNTTGAVVYYLFFASPKPVAQQIVTDIFNKYRDRGTT